MRPVTAIDEQSAVLADAAQRERDAYLDGRADGYREAELDMAEAWGALTRRIRADASRIRRSIPEPVDRPQPDDEMWFTADEWASWAGVR